MISAQFLLSQPPHKGAGNSKIKAGALAVTCCVASDGSGRIVTANGNYTVIRGCVQLPAKPNTGKTFRVPFYLLT